MKANDNEVLEEGKKNGRLLWTIGRKVLHLGTPIPNTAHSGNKTVRLYLFFLNKD